ncbi:hypothetical protein [Pectobacterium carotovorum]|uniref:hypothetical protein n=1 Tax=Pectobacterium carotovorum TaxID=554 RepID=UPI0013F4A10B|nr:hypothetical protein [Pectobacterium carotovorum]
MAFPLSDLIASEKITAGDFRMDNVTLAPKTNQFPFDNSILNTEKIAKRADGSP